MGPPPSRPQASRSSTRSSAGENDPLNDGRLTQQAGRSATNLAAQQSAQSIREATRPSHRSPSRSRSTPNLLRKKRRPSPRPVDSTLPLITSSGPSPYTPTILSSLHPAPVVRTANDERAESENGSHESSKENRPPVRHHKSSPSMRLKVPEIRVSKMSQSQTPDDQPTLHSPHSLRDLGSDYTRYPSPYMSQSDTSHHIRAANSRTYLMTGAADGLPGADVSRRLSDPFKDSKRISNPFEAAFGGRVARALQQTESRCTNDTSTRTPAITTPSRPGTPIFVRDGDPEKPAFFQYLDDRLGAPGHVFPLMTDEKEDDDEMHMPRWDDDIRLKPKLRDHFTRDNIVSTFGLFLMLAGILFVFVALPIISYLGPEYIEHGPGYRPPDQDPWRHVNDWQYPLMKNIRSGLIDPDTPSNAMSRTSVGGEVFNLVFSDEFNKPNRSFYHGDDPFWFAFDGWYGATQDLEWYDPDAINTADGTLTLTLDQFRNHDLDYRSGMLNSWNQLCFKGGIFEVSMSLPGPAGVHGLWPGVWTMGNLGRPGYLATTDGVWPYTYSECDSGITANQSMDDGTSKLPGQRLASCTCSGEDHPSPGKGRGAPEIDVAEVSGDWSGLGLGVATQSFQVAPFDIWYYPDYEYMQNPNREFSMVNTWTGGPFQEAVSTTTMLNNTWYDGERYQRFAFEYSPGTDEDAYIAWTVGDLEMMRFDGRAVGPNGNIGQRQVSEEPMSLIMNLGISHSWVDVEFSQLRFPTTMRIDYVRWYQREGEEIVTCDPPGYETTEYIANHPVAYQNPNVTTWEAAGYSWPKNTYIDGC